MTTHRAPAPRSARPPSDPGRPVGRAVTAALVHAAAAGFAWVCGMVYTVVRWPL
jgi:hypothetical protein